MFGRSSALLLGYTSLSSNTTTLLVPLDGLNSRCDIHQYTLTLLPSMTTHSPSVTTLKTYTHIISPYGKKLTSVLHFDKCQKYDNDDSISSSSSSSSSSHCICKNDNDNMKYMLPDGTYRVAIELIEHDDNYKANEKYGHITYSNYRVRSINEHPDDLIWVDLHFSEDGKYHIYIYIYIYILRLTPP